MKPTSAATRSGDASFGSRDPNRLRGTYRRVRIQRRKWVAKQEAIRAERNARQA